MFIVKIPWSLFLWGGMRYFLTLLASLQAPAGDSSLCCKTQEEDLSLGGHSSCCMGKMSDCKGDWQEEYLFPFAVFFTDFMTMSNIYAEDHTAEPADLILVFPLAPPCSSFPRTGFEEYCEVASGQRCLLLQLPLLLSLIRR